MIDSGVPQLIAAERLREGLVLKFDDGRCGFYSNAHLYASFPEGGELDEAEVIW